MYNKIVIITDLGDKMKNYSRQREAILEVLRSTDIHPTASWIYTKVKERIPNISLGTVYRNLAALSEAGEILNFSVGDLSERYDGNANPHLHLYCRCCGSITDSCFKSDIISQIASEYEFSFTNSVLMVYGICKNCKN